MQTTSIAGLLPVLIFLVLALGLAIAARRRSRAAGEGGFVKEYFIGNRTLGGFVLAMTTIATYGSVSSFVGGPGQAWQTGFGWVYMAAVQVTTLFLLYGIMGKKMALVSRKLGAVTVIDVIRARFRSNALANAAALIIVLFFAATMVAQFVGGAKLFEAVTDALCGIAMLVGIVVLAAGILIAGGGWENIMGTIRTNHPQMLEPLSGGTMPVSLYFTQWLLVGIFTFALPQSVVRCMGYKDTKSLRGAMIGGTIIIGAMMIGVTTLGVLSAGVLTGDLASYGGSVDNIIPRTIVETLPPWLAGVAIVGPVAASISTVSSLLIASSSAIIKDLWLHYAEDKGQQVSDAVVARSSQIITLGVGVIVFVLAVVPPSVIWKINMFAFGGLETAFCWVLVGALFFKRANKVGAIASMVGGTAVYCLCMALGFKLFGLHQIVIGITVSLLCMAIGSWIGNRRANAADAAADAEMREVFFPEA